MISNCGFNLHFHEFVVLKLFSCVCHLSINFEEMFAHFLISRLVFVCFFTIEF